MPTVPNPMFAPSWPAAQAAKTSWDTLRADQNASDEDKKTAESAYRLELRKCLREVGLT